MPDEIVIEKMLNSEKLMTELNRIVQSSGTDYIDAVVHLCNEQGFEVEAVAAVIKKNPTMKAKLKMAAEDLNFLPKSARLPIDD